jgi:fluoroacetyl-CoA thioesterase
MKASLKPGLTHRITYKVPVEKTVPYLFDESKLFQAMPRVFATGFMVGLLEWSCTALLAEHLEEDEGSLGIHVDFNHLAATPPGLTVTVDAELTELRRNKASFFVRAHDGVDLISEGRHQRGIVTWSKFNARVAQKAVGAGVEWNYQ